MSTMKVALITAASGIALMACAPVQTKQQQAASPNPWIRPVQAVRHAADSDLLYRTGRIFHQQGRYDEALLAYRQAVAQDGNNVEARNGMAVVYALKGDAERAENELRIAIGMAPEAAHLRNNLGYLLAQQGRTDEAREELARAQGLAPGDVVVESNLAAVAAPPVVAMADPALVAQEPLPVAQPVTPSEPVPVAQPLEPVASAQPATAPAVEMHHERFQHATFHGYRIEVSNGNGTNGLARRTSYLLASLDFERARLTNDKPFGRVESTVQYVPGAEDAAREVSAHLPMPLPVTEVAKLERNAKVRVLLGRDFPAHDPAIARAKPPKPRA